MKTVMAVQPFEHGGRRARGAVFGVSEAHAMQLLERGLVRFVERSPSKLAGATFVCIASGPSLTREDCDRVQKWRDRCGGRVIVINTSFRLAPWADVLYACDLKWWEETSAEVRAETSADLWTQSTEAARRFGLNLVKGRGGEGLGRDLIHLGGNSGYQVINLAYLWGARRIVLLGYDMQPTGGRSHWHGDHPWKAAGVKPPTRSWLPRFSKLAADLAAEGVEVINATRETALRCFPRADLEDVL